MDLSRTRTTIAQKLVSSLALLIAVSFIGLTSLHLVKQYHMSMKQGELFAWNESFAYISQLEVKADRIETALRMIASVLRDPSGEATPEPALENRMLKEMLTDHTELLSVYTVWDTSGQATGYFSSFATRLQGGGPEAETAQELEVLKNGYEQLKLQASDKPLVLEPYTAGNGESAVPVLTMLMPVQNGDGRVTGAIGCDLSLGDVQSNLENLHPLDGYAAIVTGQGVYAANGRSKDLLLQPYEPIASGESAALSDERRPSMHYVDGERGRMLQLTYPLQFIDNAWHFELYIPVSSMLTGFYDSLKQTAVVMIVALFTLIALMILLIRKVIVNNIMKVVEVSSALAKGSVRHKLDIHTQDEFGLLAAHFNRMINYRKEAEELVRHQATHDLLTGLPNRYGYNRYVDSCSVSGTGAGQVVLLYIDIDRFKYVNEKLDFTMGDMLLKHIALRIMQIVDDRGKVFRFTSDEFVVLLERVGHLHDANRLAEDLLLEIAKPVQLKERVFYVTASIGMSVQPELSPELGERLVKEADLALYMAKKVRNTSRIYSPSMNELPIKEASLESGLFSALENSQFMLYYQPKVDIVSGKIYGAEALIRWKHPELGMVPPMEFIPLAEKTGFIIPLGEWVLREACRQVRAWDEQGLHELSVSVNMSMIQFQQKHIVHTIDSIIKEEGVSPSRIELELTESIFMDNPDHTLRILHELKQLGLSLSLDDFGTGYSSLSYLQSVPIHYLKLDKSFIHDIVSDFRKQMIYKSLIVIAHNLDLKVVTEGVETAEELDIIRDHKCDSVQGYLYSPPVPPDQFVQLFQKNIA